MNFRVDKQELLNKIRGDAQNASMSYLYQLTSGNEITMYQLRDAIANAIADAVEQGFSTMLENRYTDEDFENDVGLK